MKWINWLLLLRLFKCKPMCNSGNFIVANKRIKRDKDFKGCYWDFGKGHE